MATLKDVAAQSGVSVSVVSRVLNGDPNVRARQETRDRIMAASKELNYSPNSAGRNLRNSRTHLFALVVPDVTNATFAELASAVEAEAAERGYSVLLGSSEYTQPGAPGFSQLLDERRVDGVLLQKHDEVAIATIAEPLSHRQQHRVVFVNSGPVPGFSAVALPDEQGARVAADRLLDAGHRRIAFAGGRSDTSVRREAGMRSALEARGAGLGAHDSTAFGYTLEAGRVAARALLDTADRPSAIVVANANAAFGVLLEARELGLRVPEDVSVIAMHDVAHAVISSPALTTVRMPMAELGRTAVAALVRRIEGGDAEHLTVNGAEPVVVERASVAPFAGA